MVTELFGNTVLDWSLSKLKAKINALPPTQAERRSYLLHDWAAATGHKLTENDFVEVIGYNERK
jgi:hypothetical protein